MRALSEYLQQMDGLLPDEADRKITILEEGFSNKVYLVHWRKSPTTVVRVPILDAKAFAIDRELELAIWLEAAKAGLTAELLWWNEQGVTASQYLKAKTLPWDVTHDSTSLQRMLEVVSKLHALQIQIQEYNVFQIIEQWLLKIVEHPSFVEVEPLWQQVQAWFTTLDAPPSSRPLVLCHNDLNPKNIMFDSDRAWLIDWESAGLNDPLFDLAVMMHAQHLSDEQIECAIEQLFGEAPNQEHWAALNAYRKAYVIRELVWLLMKHLYAPQDLDCLQWYHALINDPVFNPYFSVDTL